MRGGRIASAPHETICIAPEMLSDSTVAFSEGSTFATPANAATSADA